MLWFKKPSPPRCVLVSCPNTVVGRVPRAKGALPGELPSQMSMRFKPIFFIFFLFFAFSWLGPAIRTLLLLNQLGFRINKESAVDYLQDPMPFKDTMSRLFKENPSVLAGPVCPITGIVILDKFPLQPLAPACLQSPPDILVAMQHPWIGRRL